MIIKKIALSAVTVGIIGAGLLSIHPVQAEVQNNAMSSLVDRISQQFNVDKSQVQTVIDQFRKEQQTTRQQKIGQREDKRLSTLVTQKKITEAQKQAILKEMSDLKSKYSLESMKNMTADERKQAHEKEQAEIKAWAQAQGIDAKYIMPFSGMRKGMHK